MILIKSSHHTIELPAYLEGREGVVVEAGGVVKQQQLISQHDVVTFAQWNVQLLLSVHQHLHPLDDVLVDDLPEL